MRVMKRGFAVLILFMMSVFSAVALTGQPASARSGPDVDDHFPGGGRRGIPVGVTIWIEFDSHMDKDSIIDGITLLDEDKREVSGKVSYNDKTCRAYFKPSKSLEYGARYRVKLSNSIEDVDGDELGSYSFYFNTVDYPVMLVNGIEVPEYGLDVNVSPVDITLDVSGAEKVVFGSRDLERRVNNYYLEHYSLKQGSNNLSFKITYEYEDDKGKTREESLTFSRKVNLVNTLEEGAVVTHDLSKSNKISYFDKQFNITLPSGFYLQQDGANAESQMLVFKAERIYNVHGNPVVSYLFNIAHLSDKDSGYTSDSFRDIVNRIEAPPGGRVSLPVDADLSEVAYRTLTVFYDKCDGISGNWVNLGGQTDAKKKTITVPFKGLGKYVVVNKMTTFRDYEAAGSARFRLEYLWIRGILLPAENAPAGYLGLVDQNGAAVGINRGEFVVMLSKALGLEFPDPYVGLGIFSDVYYTGGNSYGQNKSGKFVPIPRDNAKYIETAAKNGLLEGTLQKDGRLVFRYFDALTREHAARMIAAASGLSVDIMGGQQTQLTLSKKFKDYQAISPALQPYVLAAVEKGYMQGFDDYTFRPAQKMTRIEAAVLVYDIMEKNKLL
ncbi:S-layer homology domain-containing protein [Desulfoscipio gibsoniae]